MDRMTNIFKYLNISMFKYSRQGGFVILFSVTLSAILLSIALGIASIAIKEVKFGTNAKDTNEAFFAADTGIESVLFSDKGSGSSFVPNPGTAQTWNLVVSGLGTSGSGCAKVSVEKDNTNPPSTNTTIISKGYNIGDASCESTSSLRVERELKVTYNAGAAEDSPGGFLVDTGGNLENNLVAYWKLDEASGTRVDAFGANNLTDNNTVTSATGKQGNAGQFTKTNKEYLSVPSNAGLAGTGVVATSHISLAAWTYFDTMPIGSYQRFVGCKLREGGITPLEYCIAYNKGTNRFEGYISSSGSSWDVVIKADNFGAATTDTWYFVVLTYDGTNVSISVNNGTPNTTAFSSGIFQGTGPFMLGGAGTVDQENYMDGRIDEVGFWKKKLSAQEITDLYNSGSGNTYVP